MKNAMIALVAVAGFAVSGCASNDSMMEKETTMEKELMIEGEAMAKDEAMMKETMVEETMVAETDASTNPMMDLCFSKGGSLGEWPGEVATETCRLGDGSEYPLASIASYEAFQ